MATDAAAPAEARRVARSRGTAPPARRQAVRVGAAVATGLTLAVADGALLPFLAPMFAAQFLLADRRPLPAAKAIALAVLIAAAGQAIGLATALFGERPALLLPLLWLVYVAAFHAQARGNAAASLVLVIAVMVPLLDILYPDLGESLSLIMAKAAIGGALLAWAAHLAFPDPPPTAEDDPSAAVSEAEAAPGIGQAAAKASILLAAVTLCLVDDRLSSAVVVPVTVATVLGQIGRGDADRAALGLVVINLVGGIAATLAFLVVETRPMLAGLFLVTLAAGLLFAGRAAGDPRAGAVHAGSLTIFLVLLGLGVSPLPTSTPESFGLRLAYVAAAVLATLALAAIVRPRRRDPRPRQAGSPG